MLRFQRRADPVSNRNGDRDIAKLEAIALANAESLLQSLRYCHAHAIGCFRVNSQILPLRTHPNVGWTVKDLTNPETVVAAFQKCGAFATRNGLRLTFHPDQFVVLSSPNPQVVSNSIAELEYQAEVAGWIGADVITIHGGGSYGDKPSALDRWRRNFAHLSKGVRTRIALENDDRVYTPTDLLPVCQAAKIPLVYDVHHHRCNPDDLHEEEATKQARATWNREPLFHISSPLGGWSAPNARKHDDFIALRDFPPYWSTLDITVEVEAKAKEVAIAKLHRALQSRAAHHSGAKSPRRATGVAKRKKYPRARSAVS
jgi:UV DNA damage endonuclease